MKFLPRLIRALGCTEEDLRLILGVRNAREFRKLLRATRIEAIDIHLDPMWQRLADHVDERIGEMISVREELQRKMRSDYRHRLLRRSRITNRGK